MRRACDEIHTAGIVLQLPCPDPTSRRSHAEESLEAYRCRIRQHIEDLKRHAIPPGAMRIRLYRGNVESPHIHDVPLRRIIEFVPGARPAAISFEGANPRHAHEGIVPETVDLPDDKVLVPGVIDSTTNDVEHSELVAQWIVQYAGLVGRERVIAGSDCGFATLATSPTVYPSVTWAKLAAMAESARIASAQLWSSASVGIDPRLN